MSDFSNAEKIQNATKFSQNLTRKTPEQESKGHCNTKNAPAARKAAPSRSRNWCFTLNNYTPEEIKGLTDCDCEYVFQEETGEQGTPHLQGFMKFRNDKTLGGVRKINSRAHWEITRNKNASIAYCSKLDTRTGQIYTNMNLNQEHEPGIVNHGLTYNDTFIREINKAKKNFMEDEDIDNILDQVMYFGFDQSLNDETYKLE